MKKTASLGASLIATKGKATPSANVPLKTAGQGNAKPVGTEKRIAITVKLMENPYLRMKAYGAANRKTNQDILEVALNEYLDKLDGKSR